MNTPIGQNGSAYTLLENESAPISKLERYRNSKGVAVFIVYVSLLVDSMLLTVIVPILPAYLLANSNASEPNGAETFTNYTIPNNFTTSNATDCVEKYGSQVVANESLKVGILLAAKPLVQIVSNIFVGPICDRIGYDFPMLAGYVIIAGSCIIFTLATQYSVLLIARSLQGVGSACVATAGMAKIASLYPDNAERGRMMGLALSGLGLGVVLGPTYGSVLYQFFGKDVPFIILAAFTLLIAILKLSTMQFHSTTGRENQTQQKTPTWKLLKDPYIILAAATTFMGTISVSVLEAGMPLWMLTTMCAEVWMLGVANLPIDFSYFATTIVLSRVSTVQTRWILCLVAFFIGAAGNATLPLCKNLPQLIGPGILIGISTGLVDGSIFPIAGHIADLRHRYVYGSVYAILDASFCAAFIVGPLMAGSVIGKIGFHWTMNITAILVGVFGPLVAFLRNPTPLNTDEGEMLLSNHEESESPLLQTAKNGYKMERNGFNEQTKK